PILKSQVGTKVQVTFLSRYHDVPGGRWIRVGYHTKILEVKREHELAEGVIEPVVVVASPKRLEASTVRMAYRLIPPEDLDLRLFLRPDDFELGLMDLSIGGAQFHHPMDREFELGRLLALSLISGDTSFNLTGRVVRLGKTYDVRGRERGVTSVQFGEMEPAIRNQLTRLLTETYRYLLAQRSGIASRREDD
ncbi:MAG: PilZ domain-containing protein, partial [Pseudomonadota bacterium]